MMTELSRKEVTEKLSKALETFINGGQRQTALVYWAKEVTFDWGTNHSCRVDYMKFKPLNNTCSGIEKGDVYCYEIKSCVKDYKSENGHNFLGDYNYYVMTEETYEKLKDELRWGFVGILCPDEYGYLHCVHPPRRHNRTRSIAEVLLMMFRSSNREKVKLANQFLIQEEREGKQ